MSDSDLSRWKLEVDRGRQTWEFVDPAVEFIQSTVEKHLLGLDTSDVLPALPRARTPLEAADNGVNFYSQIQTEDGHWANDYGGPMFLMPGLVIVAYVTGVDLGAARRTEMIRYISNIQKPSGGWGIHIEADSTMFGTALNYCAMRLLGVPADDRRMATARAWIRENGGAVGVPSWGKFWLSVLGVYDWEGLYPVPPELWLLPDWAIMHPHRWWCHCRVVYLPMGYVYGVRGTGPITPLVHALRKEIHVQPYDDIDWVAQRGNICPDDMYTPHSRLHKFMFAVCSAYERVHSSWVRGKALELTLDHIRSEDENTDYICIGPVNKVINMLVRWLAEGPESEAFQRHAERLPDYLFMAHDGLKMQGYNGSQLWDTAFSIQAILATGLADKYQDCLRRAYHYLDITQVMEDVPDKEHYYRHQSKGAWPFSSRDHGWPISDCTAEGLKCVLDLHKLPWIDASTIPDHRLDDAVDVIMSLQNTHAHGGWATYELQRAPAWLELINPSEVFGDIMIDYEYVECSSACVQALCRFLACYPQHPQRTQIRQSIAHGVEFIKSIQRDDGSWIGSWGVCFTYGTWFGVEGLITAGEDPRSPAIVRACEFLLSKQSADGGWGESFLSCVDREWRGCESQVVNTAWAVLALIKADWPDQAPIRRGIQLIMDRQLDNGDWKQERIKGVFNANCMISYNSYRNVFPIWALGEYAHRYPQVVARL